MKKIVRSAIYILSSILFVNVCNAEEIGDYEVGESGVYFFINADDFVSFYCTSKEDLTSPALTIKIPLSDENVNSSTKGQDILDQKYKGYSRYPTERFAIYLSIYDKKTKKKHPIDDYYITPIQKLEYASDTNADAPYVWTAYFDISSADLSNLAPMLMSNHDMVLRVNSWSKTIAEIPFPRNGKKSAFLNYRSPCWGGG